MFENKNFDTYDSNFEQKIKDEILYHKIVKICQEGDQQAKILLDNGVVLQFFGNEGCGGCSNGWFYLKDLLNNIPDNAITNVKLEAYYDSIGDCTFSIFIFCENEQLNLVSYSGHDNGYYGEGFSVVVRLEEKNEYWENF